MISPLVFVLQTLIALAVPYGLWRLLRLHGIVPWVVIQILVGVLLGPSFFGRIAPEAHAFLFSPPSVAAISGLATIAVLMFGFVTGLHFEPSVLHGRGRAFAGIALAGIATPFALGALAGFAIVRTNPEHLGLLGNTAAFAVAIGICTAVTALPVLALIIKEMRLLKEQLGQTAIALAALNDVALWIGLAGLMAALTAADEGAWAVARIAALSLLYVLAARHVVHPLLHRMLGEATKDSLGDGALIAVLLVGIASAAVSQAIGLHYVLGAFLGSLLIPAKLRAPILDKLEAGTIILLMPFFFVVTGTKVRFDYASGEVLLLFAAFTAAAVAGKLAGTSLPARLAGHSWREGLALSALLQSKGLLELVVASTLYDAGVIGRDVFSALVLMALFCTILAAPMARLFLRR